MQTCEQLEKLTITIGEGERAIPMDAGVFLHGNCGIFAMALHERFGYSIEHVVAPADDDDDDEEDSVPGTQLVHIYCLDGDTLYDVRGGTDDEDFFFEEFSDWVDGREDYYPMGPDECHEFVLGCMSKEEYQEFYTAALKFIDEHESWYRNQ